MKKILSSLGIAVSGGAIAMIGYSLWVEQPRQVVVEESPAQSFALHTSNNTPLQWDSFSHAAETAVNSVVHVKTAVEQGYYVSPFRGFSFGDRGVVPRIVEGSGSGVIVSEDGYIVTNNHVVANAKNVEITTNDNRRLKAEVVGTDPATDIAVLKVEAEDLTPLPFADSDELRLGQWVLAVGNPFNLNSTVTAGIVSAKGRKINVIDERSAIESFIQTDAAVNPGNSGGALVNISGDLVGINTAISTHTGSFEGYSFAVPGNLVQKVVDDIIRYGVVQRAYLGVNITNVTPQLSQELELDVTNGVYVADVVDGSAASEAGLERGDIITRIDRRNVTQTSELLEVVGSKRPGDQVSLTVKRNGSDRNFDLTLTNSRGNTELIHPDEPSSPIKLGGTFEELSSNDKRALRIRNGVVVADPGEDRLAEAGVPRGFIIVKVNNQRVNTSEDINRIISELQPGDGVLIQGYHPTGKPDYYAFGM